MNILTKQFGRILFFTMIVSILISCNKKDKEDILEDDTSEQFQQSKDELYVSNESDVNLDELNQFLSGSTAFGKAGIISGATIDDTTYASERKIVITYNGLNRSGTRNRVGVVTIQLLVGTKWQDPGSVLKITYSNLVISNTNNTASVTLNGNHIITNRDGGRAFVDSIVTHTIRGTMTVTFDDGSSRSWSVARKRTMRNADLVYSVEVSGDTSVSGINNVVIWGTNRKGNPFFTQIQQPIVWSSICSSGPLSGVKVHKGLSKEITVTFGVDASGNPVTGNCPYGIRINWTNLRGDSKSAVIGY